jgi:hypothetical protein
MTKPLAAWVVDVRVKSRYFRRKTSCPLPLKADIGLHKSMSSSNKRTRQHATLDYLLFPTPNNMS